MTGVGSEAEAGPGSEPTRFTWFGVGSKCPKPLVVLAAEWSGGALLYGLFDLIFIF